MIKSVQEFISEYKDIFGLTDVSSSTILSISMIMVILFIFKKINNFYLISLLTLPGTFMHELMHFMASFFTFGRPIKFSIFPKKSKGTIVLGSVSSANVTWYNALIISLAPLLLYILAYYMTLSLASITTPLYYYATIYFIANILFAGTPSPADWRLAFQKSWLILSVLLLAALEYYFKLFALADKVF